MEGNEWILLSSVFGIFLDHKILGFGRVEIMAWWIFWEAGDGWWGVWVCTVERKGREWMVLRWGR